MTSKPADHTKGEVLASIRALVAALQRSARSIEQRTGVTNAQLFVLRQLAASDALSINELAALALTQQSTVSTVVGRLAGRGLVRRRRASSDGRRVTVSLTSAGRQLLRHAPKPPTGRLLDALTRLGRKDLTALASGLQALTTAMGLRTQGAAMLFEENGAVRRAAAAPSRIRIRTPR